MCISLMSSYQFRSTFQLGCRFLSLFSTQSAVYRGDNLTAATEYMMMMMMGLGKMMTHLKSKLKSLKVKKVYDKIEKSESMRVEIRSRKARKLIEQTLRIADSPKTRSYAFWTLLYQVKDVLFLHPLSDFQCMMSFFPIFPSYFKCSLKHCSRFSPWTKKKRDHLSHKVLTIRTGLFLDL